VSTTVSAPHRERALAWAMDVIACLYVSGQLAFLWLGSGVFAKMFDGLGVDLPNATRLVVNHGFWLYPVLMVVFSAGLVGKE
jgi:hypothetical protein